MTDADLIALCAFREANLEPDDGVAAVVRVILNRMALRYQSDGTVQDTIFHGNGVAFSWAAFDMIGGHYTRVASGLPALLARAQTLLVMAQHYQEAWARTQRIASAVCAGTYAGTAYAAITPDTVLYLNPDPRLVPHPPAWMNPANLVTTIGRHSFYRDH